MSLALRRIALACALLLPPAPGRAANDVLEGGLEGARSLVIVLHGGSWSPRGTEELARRALNDLSSEGRRAGLRLLVPLLPEGLGRQHEAAGAHTTVPWIAPAGEARVLALIEHEVARGRADEDRIYLAGHGAGATAAVHLAARHPERIAAVALWSGTPSPLWDEERHVVGLLEDPVTRLQDVAVFLWTARDDPVLDRDALDLFVSGLRAREKAERTRLLEWVQGEGGHGYGKTGARRGLKFLKGQRKRRRP